ncbi:hypothetical protein Rsub_04285 [Raphidocelis subcapitata]|uniref:CRAL-TRIO domain-containing protein n=1 Tax=Raphidocelis subcapitata TaxID=307507 RepID=A0A2V0P398_9CHLO|nr:hypothetical protein Rsub_04285 [Raphidocelis subcapitata]|eukprot:GBF91545.1 hypothetical protein Rsub_04285 [Raphidocelis subcapitata]
MRRTSLSHRHSIQQRELSGLGHEAAVLAEFKQMVADAGLVLPPELVVNGDTDATLRRFLRARKFKVEAAMAMLEKSLAWRRRVRADEALRAPLPRELVTLVRECRPSSYIGFHREGFPIFVERLGMLDAERIEREKLTEEQLLSYHQREMEFMAQVVFVEASRRAGHTIDRVVSIMDAAGLTFSMLTGFAQRLFRALAGMDSDNYPETCNSIFIVNNSAAFTTIWRMLRVFVDAGTREKVKVLGSGNPMLAALLQEFDASQIPSFLGGTLDYDERRRQWLEVMDAAMAEAAARGKEPEGSPLNGFERPSLPGALSGLRTAGSLISEVEEDEGGFGTPASAASRASSALSVYFDALEGSGASVTRASTSSGGPGSASSSLAGTSPGGSPRAGPRGGGGGGSFGGGNGAAGSGGGGSPYDTHIPNYTPSHQHHLYHQESKLAAVPSGDLVGEGPQPKCCVIS